MMMDLLYLLCIVNGDFACASIEGCHEVFSLIDNPAPLNFSLIHQVLFSSVRDMAPGSTASNNTGKNGRAHNNQHNEEVNHKPQIENSCACKHNQKEDNDLSTAIVEDLNVIMRCNLIG